MKLGAKVLSIFQRKEKPVRTIAAETGIPRSTVHYHRGQINQRITASDTDFWETEQGRAVIIRLVIATIYVFALKSGNGAGRLNEFFELLQLDRHTGVSNTTILNIIKQVESLILEYNKSVEANIRSRIKEIKLILGVDETWFDNMYLVCQELSSGYLFFETTDKERNADAWNEHIKKNF